MTGSTVQVGNGGLGGPGGNGGFGGRVPMELRVASGTPELGHFVWRRWPGRFDGPGGDAGAGGNGGPGFGIVRASGSTATVDNATTINVGSASEGGVGGTGYYGSAPGRHFGRHLLDRTGQPGRQRPRHEHERWRGPPGARLTARYRVSHHEKLLPGGGCVCDRSGS